MSGRVRVTLPDGRRVIGFRKTARQQGRRKTLTERAHEFNDAAAKRNPGAWARGVRIGFFLPDHVAPFVADGPHGHGVFVHRGFVQVMGGSSEECFVTAEEFLGVVAKNKRAFIAPVSVVKIEDPNFRGARWLSVVNGAMVVCSGMREPHIYGDQAA